MTAVPDENNNNVQSVIEKITSNLDETTVDKTKETTDENIPDQDVVDETTIVEPELVDDPKAQKAFAAMRVANKAKAGVILKLEERLKVLEEKGLAPEQTTEENEETETNVLEIKDTDSEEVKALKTELAGIKELTEEFKQDKTQRITKEAETKMITELTGLKTKYTLDQKALLDFADDAEKAGFVLGKSPLSLDQIYKVVYHDSLVANAVKAVEAATNDGVAPATGPSGSGSGNTGGKRSMQEIIDAVNKKTGGS